MLNCTVSRGFCQSFNTTILVFNIFKLDRKIAFCYCTECKSLVICINSPKHKWKTAFGMEMRKQGKFCYQVVCLAKASAWKVSEQKCSLPIHAMMSCISQKYRSPDMQQNVLKHFKCSPDDKE